MAGVVGGVGNFSSDINIGGSMKTYDIVTTQKVTQEQIDDIMATALEGGITYWCGEVRVSEEPSEEYKYASDVLTRDGVLELYDAEEEKWVHLNLTNLLNALGELKFDFDNYDAADADEAVQKAIFGEVVYA